MNGDISFSEALERVCRCELDRVLQQWALGTAFDPATTAMLLFTSELSGVEELLIAIACALPPELDRFTEEDFLRWMQAAASSQGTNAL